MREYWRQRLRLLPGWVDVVTCRLDLEAEAVDALAALLDPAETARARRFRSADARRAYVVARGRLRELLGAVLDRAPEAVRLGAGPHGKPALAGPAAPGVRFNLAHSGQLALCALTQDDEVGVDLEEVRDVEIAEVASRFFAAAEARSLAALPPSVRREAFFACWTRKEAILKATGDGLRQGLDRFVVSVEPERAVVLATDGDFGRPEDWSLLPVPLSPGYQGTVALRRPRAALRLWPWPAGV